MKWSIEYNMNMLTSFWDKHFKDLSICTRLLTFKLIEGFVYYVSDSISMLGYFHMHVILGLSE